MLITITKDNLAEVIRNLLASRNLCNYNDECFSSSDIRFYTNAGYELNEIVLSLWQAGVNLYAQVRPVYLQNGYRWNDVKYGSEVFSYLPTKLPDDFSLAIELKALKCPYELVLEYNETEIDEILNKGRI
jgi:hypothetical protein